MGRWLRASEVEGMGYTLMKNILYAYLPLELAKAGTRLELDLIEARCQGEVSATVLFRSQRRTIAPMIG